MNINETNMERIPAEKFEFVQLNDKLHDKKLETKPIGFFQDAMIRFSQNKGSVVCGIILLILILFAIFGPVVSNYEITEKDGYYSFALPKMSAKFDLGFWNGCTKKQYTQANYDYLCALGAIKKEYGTETAVIANKEQIVYNVSVDSYARRGFVDILIDADELAKAQEYEKETGIRLFYPLIDANQVACPAYRGDTNAWFLTDQKGVAQRDADGNFINIYLKDENSPYGDGYKYFSAKQGAGQNAARVSYADWYYYKNGKAPCFWFGADEFGYDIFTRLAAGARLSFLVSMSAALVELIIGIIIGACEGYYGGTFDILMERFKEIFGTIPTLVAITLFQIYFARKGGSLLVFWITLILWGWIGVSSTVRAQFYRFKGMEYVMASRTLGAKDRRLIFRHILPNASGFIITSSVLVIPNIINSESTFSFLGVINLNSRTMTSVGALLSNGQSTLTTYPHCVFFPAAFLGILLICFNIFGNGLRDAFNPTLRGAN